MMKVIWFLLWRNQGDTPCLNLFFRQGLKALFRLPDGLLDDAQAIVEGPSAKTAAVIAARFSFGTS